MKTIALIADSSLLGRLAENLDREWRHGPLARTFQNLSAYRLDVWFLGLLLALINVPIMVGWVPNGLVFQADAVTAGEWWRVFMHPFVHVSWYHLLLDGAAFLILYSSLRESWFKRMLYIAFAAVGSLGAAWALTDLANGLCGLSGVAHGLMAVSALEMISGALPNSSERRIGWISFAAVMGKAAYEVVTGRMFLEFLHFGLLGSPVAVSHVGGILGGLLIWVIWRCRRYSN